MRPDPAFHPRTSGRDLVRALALELRSLRDLARSLPVASATCGPDGVRAAQGQDLLDQTLDELASFLERSTDAFGPEPLGDLQPALGRIRLGALAQRLSCTGSAKADVTGELELF